MDQTSEDFSVILKSLKQGNLKSFETIYNKFHDDLCIHALKYTPDRNLIQDIVQDTFLDLWHQRRKLNVKSTLKGYLYRMVYYKLMDAFKNDSKKNNEYLSFYQSSVKDATTPLEGDDDYKNILLAKLDLCLNSLPKRCKKVFLDKKISGLKYIEIAKNLEISIKTVEGHIRRAYALIKACMQDLNVTSY